MNSENKSHARRDCDTRALDRTVIAPARVRFTVFAPQTVFTNNTPLAKIVKIYIHASRVRKTAQNSHRHQAMLSFARNRSKKKSKIHFDVCVIRRR